MKRWPVIGLTLAVLWLFINGVTTAPADIVTTLMIGLLVGMPVAYVFRRFYNTEIDVLGSLAAVPFAVLYVLLFFWELLTANIDVAYRVLSPSMPIEPDVVEVPLRVESDLAVTTIANSISLTPGTLTMDYNDERNALYVHGITGANKQAILEPIRRWEDYALRIFDEERAPGDPVPDPDRIADRSGGESDGE
ncbi:MAG: Na+/H+ antiporter subunit E [Halapricum sp.]